MFNFNFGFKKSNVADEDLSKIIEENREKPSSSPLSDKEKELLSAAIKFHDLEAEEVCVPTSELWFVNIDYSLEDTLKKFAEGKLHKLLVINENIDSIIGYINLFDVLEFIKKPKSFSLNSIVRECLFVPKSLNLVKVVTQMQNKKTPLAVVVDDYGGTTGLISLKDILTEFVGEIHEEDEEFKYDNSVSQISDNQYITDPRISIDDLIEKIPNFNYVIEQDEDDFETLSGLILQITKKIPIKDEVIELSNEWKAKILDANSRKINKVELLNEQKSNRKTKLVN